MSTSFLYHAFGAKGYNFLAYNFVKGHISIKIVTIQVKKSLTWFCLKIRKIRTGLKWQFCGM
jgi:hypothetical protein